MQFLSELLNFAPLIITDVWWHVLDLQFCAVLLLTDLDMLIATEFSWDLSCSIWLLVRLMFLIRLCIYSSWLTRWTSQNLIEVLDEGRARARPSMILRRIWVGTRILHDLLIGVDEGEVADGTRVAEARINRVQSCGFLDRRIHLLLASHSTLSVWGGWVVIQWIAQLVIHALRPIAIFKVLSSISILGGLLRSDIHDLWSAVTRVLHPSQAIPWVIHRLVFLLA